MRITDMNWMQAEAALRRDDRCVLPIGSVEQHAYLSLATDVLLAERVSAEAAEPLGVPVFPPLAYGFTPSFRAYPGTVSLSLSTFLAVMRDLLCGLHDQGFRRIVVVNGHGGNSSVASLIAELMADRGTLQAKLHNWWNAPRTWACVRELEPDSAHASWMENLPWTRIAGAPAPATAKPRVDYAQYALLGPQAARALAGDGNFGGSYQRPEADGLRMWAAAVEETRALIEGPWRPLA
jgi:creatinine amidohydrolase